MLLFMAWLQSEDQGKVLMITNYTSLSTVVTICIIMDNFYSDAILLVQITCLGYMCKAYGHSQLHTELDQLVVVVITFLINFINLSYLLLWRLHTFVNVLLQLL